MASAKKLGCTWPEARLEPRRLRVADDYLQGVLDGKNFLVFDGAMGTQLQTRGLAAGELPELLCLTNPGEISEVHAAYVAAGADVVTTNTFGATSLKLAHYGLENRVAEINAAAVQAAKRAANGRAKIAGDLGPTGRFIEPLGDLGFETGTGTQITTFLNPTVGLDVCIEATIVMIVAGTIAGLIPARKAAWIKPIEAL